MGWVLHSLFYKHKGYKYIEGENHVKNKYILSMCPGWQNSLSISYNLGQKICRLFHFLSSFLFTISETEPDYYHQKVNVRVISQVAERLKT